MEQLEAIFKKFSDTNEDYAHAFIMGQTSHWLTIIINKVNGFTETLLMDSRNSFILGLSLDELQNYLISRIRKFGKDEKTYPQWKKDVAIMSYLDTQHTISLFHHCAIGKHNIRYKLFDFFVEGFFELYENSISSYRKIIRNNENKINQTESDQSFLIGFINWLENFSPPAVIEKNMIRTIEYLGIDNLSDRHWTLFHDWIQQITKNVDLEESDIPVIKRFRVTHSWFISNFVLNSIQYLFQ